MKFLKKIAYYIYEKRESMISKKEIKEQIIDWFKDIPAKTELGMKNEGNEISFYWGYGSGVDLNKIELQFSKRFDIKYRRTLDYIIIDFSNKG